MLDEDEYLSMTHVAEELGLSHSAFIRTVIKERVKRYVMSQLSANGCDQGMTETSQQKAIVGNQNLVSLLKTAL